MKKVLITGGAGYIGSTVASLLADGGTEVVVLDDLSSGREEFAAAHSLYVGDVGDQHLIRRIFADHPDIESVVHCAAKISVPDSVADPVGYFDNNVTKGLRLLEALNREGCNRLVFASSASVYGNPSGEELWVDESSPVAPASPYAQTKAIFDQALSLSCRSGWGRAISLRFFNPVGSDPKFRTGLPSKDPGHVLGKIITAWRSRQTFTVTGTDWPTPDGTGLRDYIHVWDLARGVVEALRRLRRMPSPHEVINLGTGNMVTVRGLVDEFERTMGSVLDVADAPARPGDVAGAYARCDLAAEVLGWKAEKSLSDAIQDAVDWDLKFRPSL